MLRLILLPFSTWAAIHFFATAVDHPLIRAEGLFLAPTVAALLAVLLGVAPRPRLEAPAVAVLATAVVWGVHALSTPAAAIGAMVVVALLVAGARRSAADDWELDLPALCALAIGLQILLRPELFLAGPSFTSRLLEWLLLPVAGAVATFALQRAMASRGLLTALLAIAASGGWSPLVVLWIAAAAAASHALGPDGEIRRPAAIGWLITAALLAWRGPEQVALLLSLTVGGWWAGGALGPETRRAVRLGALFALLTAVAWLLFAGARGGWPAGLETAALFALLMPTLAWTVLRRARRILPLLAVTALGLVALPAATALVPALAFAGAVLPRGRPLLAAQGVWSAAVGGAALLLGGYPWLRGEPVVEALRLFGAERPKLAAALAIAAAVALGAATSWSRSRRFAARTAPQAALVLALLAVAARLPPAGTPLTTKPVLLRAENPIWTATTPGTEAIRAVVVDSYLTYAAKLPAGARVARVTLAKNGHELAAWTLRAGRDTGEWATRRPDIAAQAGFVPAPVWIAWVEPERRFFAQRHRARLVADAPVDATEMSIERTVVDDKVELALTHVEVRP